MSHLNEADEMIELDWVEGEPESLPFGDHSFDRVLSAFGHMFVPRQSGARAATRSASARPSPARAAGPG